MRALHRVTDALVSHLAPKAKVEARCVTTAEYCSPCNGTRMHTCCYLAGCIEVCYDKNC